MINKLKGGAVGYAYCLHICCVVLSCFSFILTSDKFYDLIVNVDILTIGRELRNQRVRKPPGTENRQKIWLVIG